MAKATTTANAVSFKSLKDGAYRQASATQTIESVARYCLDTVAGFPETISPEAKDELYNGYRMKFNELNPAQTYAVLNGVYANVEQLSEAPSDKTERVTVGVEFAYSFTNQEFGKLKDENPQLHSLIKTVRDKCSTYCSNRLGDLKRTAKKLTNDGKERERVANKTFDEFVDDWLKNIAPTRLRNAVSRGNNSDLDVKRFNEAVVAFRTVWTV